MSTYYPIGTSGHRSQALFSYAPYSGQFPPAQNVVANPYAPTYPHVQYSGVPYQTIQQQHQPQPQQQEPSAPNGGISPVLDYEPRTMASFLCWCTYGMLNQNRVASTEMEAAVVYILNATRLPKTTIIIALEYINQRFSDRHISGESSRYTAPDSMSDSLVFLRLVVSLVLANKFNDDNTFTNRSWCGASGLNIKELNSEEAAWLSDVDWDLNVLKFQTSIDTLQECWRMWNLRTSPTNSVPAYVASQQQFTSPAPSYESVFSGAPPSPGYDSSSSVYSYSPVRSSPLKPNVSNMPWQSSWNTNMYSQPSIWTSGVSACQYPYMAQRDGGYYRYSNYYNCTATY